MFTIYLNNLHFKSYHGLFNEEKIIGNHFIVDVEIKYQHTAETVVNIEQTINYATIYEVIKQRMSIATELLETLSQDICNTLVKQFGTIIEINFCITKKNAPIEKFIGDVKVCYQFKK